MEGDQETDIKEIDNRIRKKIKWTWLEEKDPDGYFLWDYVGKLIITVAKPSRTKVVLGRAVHSLINGI